MKTRELFGSNERVDGCATFFKRDSYFLMIMNSLSRFEISGQLEISFNRLADELLADRSITPVFSFISYMNQ